MQVAQVEWPFLTLSFLNGIVNCRGVDDGSLLKGKVGQKSPGRESSDIKDESWSFEKCDLTNVLKLEMWGT